MSAFIHYFAPPHQFANRLIPEAPDIEYLRPNGTTPCTGEGQIVALPEPVTIDGVTWTHAIQLDDGKQRLLDKTPEPGPYRRATQRAVCYAHLADGTIVREPDSVVRVIDEGGFVFFRAHTFMMCTSHEAALAWVRASRAIDEGSARLFADIMTGPGKRIATMLLGPPGYGYPEEES